MPEGLRAFVAAGPLTVLFLCVVCMAYLLSAQNSLSTGGDENVYRATFSDQNWRLPPPLHYQNASAYAEMMVEQTRRKALIEKACREANMSRELDLGAHGERVFKSVGHLLVDDKYKVLFGFIPKVGCTTWKGVMRRLRGTHKGDMSTTATLRGFKGNLTEITYRLQNYRKVLFVREPIVRMLSAYLSKLRNFGNLQRTWERYIGRSIVRQYRGYDHDERYKDEGTKPWMNITLLEYIAYITDKGSGITMDELNDHWLPLNVVSNPCQIRYDFIGHYENLAVEGPLALQWLGLDGVISFPDVHGSHASSSLVDEYSRVPIHLLKRLSVYYAFDYKAFGYDIQDTIRYLIRAVFHDGYDDGVDNDDSP